MNCIRLLAFLVAITVLPFFCIEKAAARYDPYVSDPNTSFFGRLIILNDELNTAGGTETSIQQTQLLEAALQPFDLRGSRPTPTNRVSLQPSNLPTASGGGRNLSRDGLCAVGYQDAGFFTPFHALRWTAATGPRDLGTLGGGQSFGTDTNQDCSVVVGYSEIAGGGGQHAFRWTSVGGTMEDLNLLAGTSGPSRALGVSSNGNVIVGDSTFGGTFPRAFRWAGSTFTELVSNTVPSLATAVSADGTVVVGKIGTSTASSAFRWTIQNPVAQLIAPLGTDKTAAATAVSDNGKIVVGISHPDFLDYQDIVTGWNQGKAFRWTQATGTQELGQVLSGSGIDMTGITLVSVTGMSPDGQWIQGRATTAQTGPNETVAFIAQICDADIGGPCSTTGAAPFTVGATPNQLTVSAGQSGTSTITVTPDAGFAQPVNFSCSGLPTGASCSFAPPSVTPNGGPVNTTLTISTNGGPVALLSPGTSPTMFAYALTPFALVLTGVLFYRRRTDRQNLWTGLLLVCVVALVSCSSSDSSTPPVNSGGGAPATGTPAGASTVTVTASSGSGSTGVPITLTVTR
jgi:probable HAF family extracellular repeat protein